MINLLKQGLPSPDIKGRSDHELSGKILPEVKKWRKAAVLIPIVQRPEPAVLLTKRSVALRKHPGQIAFPGGVLDREDKNSAAAALRELEEEVAVSGEMVDLVGILDTYKTSTGFEVTPHVGLLPPTIEPKSQESEVSEIFEVPLKFILNRKHHKAEKSIFEGEQRQYFAICYHRYYIWGATAHMLVNLTDAMELLGYRGDKL